MTIYSLSILEAIRQPTYTLNLVIGSKERRAKSYCVSSQRCIDSIKAEVRAMPDIEVIRDSKFKVARTCEAATDLKTGRKLTKEEWKGLQNKRRLAKHLPLSIALSRAVNSFSSRSS